MAPEQTHQNPDLREEEAQEGANSRPTGREVRPGIIASSVP